MSRLILKIFDFFHTHRRPMCLILILATLLLGALVQRVNYKEDISDFLPFDSRDQDAMRIYQAISGADNILVLVGTENSTQNAADKIIEAVDALKGKLDTTELFGATVIAQANVEQMTGVSDFVYRNIPYFLTQDDYKAIRQKLSSSDYVHSQLVHDKQMLLLPSGGLLSGNIGKDPLNIFTPIMQKLSPRVSGFDYELYDGYIFTPDLQRALLLVNSPYGSSETEHNQQLVDKLRAASNSVQAQYPGITISLTGGPVIAVGNAQQIKTDSIVSVSIAVVLILVLLVVAFHSVRNIALIAVSITWGWLFALGGLSLVHNTMSVIVIGISSVIIGIAVNYPLHLIAHLAHVSDMRKALKEILMPLLIGNVTTIGAFLTLVPLKSVALRDLGLFAALLLMGTILFVLVFLPHLVKHGDAGQPQASLQVGNVRFENKTWLVTVVVVLTIVLTYFSFHTKFDSNLANINYMSAEQKADIDYLMSQQHGKANATDIYAVAAGKSMDAALTANEEMQAKLDSLVSDGTATSVSGCGQFLCSAVEQRERLRLWHEFVDEYHNMLTTELVREASTLGFSEDSFNDFLAVLSADHPQRPYSYFSPLTQGVFKGNIVYDKTTGTYNVVNVLTVHKDRVDTVQQRLNSWASDGSHFNFEIGKLNSIITESLSSNFNYIGYACAIIVFFFLWFSFGNIELALLSFLPMAISWIWILGIMGLLHIDFNIVNIVLATFIFGQGDDYTIFMTEGCQYEYAYGKKKLGSYKNSILLSAVIMFIGIGSLILAKHPALHSLAEVTIIGMFSVVLMAWLLPPLIFKWLVTKNGVPRKRPLTLKSILRPKRYPNECAMGMSPDDYSAYIRDAYYYCGRDVSTTVKKALQHCGDSLVCNTADKLVVAGGSYGAVALAFALANPGKTIVAIASNDDDADVCRAVAMRIAKNIKIERK